MSVISLLAKRKISPAVNVYYVYKAVILGEEGVPEVHRPYCDPQTFFSVTYVTPAMRQYVEDVLRRLSRGEPGVYLMPALFGAGKSHLLALLIHLVALYRRCNGVGRCVTKELEKYGIELEVPDLPKLSEVYVFRGGHELGEKEAKLRRARTKEELLRLLVAPFVIIFDETQYFEKNEPDFPLWLQMLSEVVADAGGVMLVSFSLFGGEEGAVEPDLRRYVSIDVVNRVAPVKVVLDTVDNIVSVFRRWANIRPRSVDLSPLEGTVDGNLLSEFRRRLSETYPFNPYMLDVVRKLAEESIVSETRVQLTRGLLWALAHAYVRATEEGVALATFRHLPEPEELLNVGGRLAADWKALVELYKDDVRKVGDKQYAVSVLSHVLLTTFLSRFVKSELYPAEDDLVLGSFDGFAKPSDVRAFLLMSRGLHVRRLSNGRYFYWRTGDIYNVVFDAMKQYGELDGLEEAVEVLVRILHNKAGYFGAVYISGFGPPERYEKRDHVYVVASKEEWEKRLRDNKIAVLAVDLANFGVPERRNNLAVLKRNDSAKPPRSRVLEKLKVEPSTIKDAVVILGRFVKAAKDVLHNIEFYFKNDLSKLDDETKRYAKQGIEDEIEGALRDAYSELEDLVKAWFGRMVAGFREETVDSKGFEDRIDDWHRDMDRLARSVVKTLMERMHWDGFKKVGDLWSIYLNSPELPFAPISFDKFKGVLRAYCDKCNCLFEVDGVIKWIGARGCETPEIDENTGVTPVYISGVLNTDAIEKFLRQLASDKKARYKIVYRAPTGEERNEYADALLANPSEWQYLLNDARVVVEEVKRFIAIRLDGVEASKVERLQGGPVTVEVEAGEDLEAVHYSIGEAAVQEVLASRGKATFTVEVPKEPGVYRLSLELSFKDGGGEQRVVTVVVRGKCKVVNSSQSVAAGDVLRWIHSSNIGDAAYLFDILTKRGISFTLALRASWSEGENALSLATTLAPEAREIASRVFRLLEMLRAPVDAKFEFRQPLVVDEKLKADVKARNFIYGVEREDECR